jgi:opacity protein-like surface antigen
MKVSKLNLLVVIFAVIAAFNSHAFSQTSIGLGLEGGINIANMNMTPDFNTSTRTGLMVGGFVDIGVSRVIAIRPGLRYVMKGFTVTQNNITLTDKLSYFEIPVLLKASIPLDRIKPYFVAGPTLGIRVSGTEEITDGTQVQTSDLGQFVETIDFGLYFGGGMEFRVASNTDIFAGFGYSLGLTNISKQTTSVFKNYGIQITGGVKFGL